jgi:nucleosome binding factor SPN SPT16 subunit
MEYTWANEATKTIKQTRNVEYIDTFSLDDLKEERAGILARRDVLDKEWKAFQEKIAAIEIALGVKAKDLPSVTGNLVGAK